MKRALRIGAKVIGWTLLSVVALLLSVLLTVILLGRTDWGHHKILAIALPQIQKQLDGHLKIGRIGGDLTHGLVLYDVEVDDVERQPVVRLAALTVRYNLFGLTHHQIDLTELKVEQAWVQVRVMRDGRLNVATIAKPSTTPEPPPDPNAKPYSIAIGKVWADLEARYDAPRADPPYNHINGKAHLEGHARIDGSRIEAKLETLTLATVRPLVAQIALKGGVKLNGGAISADDLRLVLDTEGAQLRKLLPNVKLRGKWQVELDASGPAHQLAVTVHARPPAGSLDVAAELATGGQSFDLDRLTWTATVKARGIDPVAAVAGTPHGDVRLDASGEGKGTHGSVELASLVAAVAGAHVDAHGRFTLAGNGQVDADVAARDLSQLRTLGINGIAGSLHAKAQVTKSGTHIGANVDAAGTQLSFAGNHVGRLQVHVHEQDFIGEAHVAAVGIKSSGLVLDSLNLDASGTTAAIKLALSAHGPNATWVDVQLHGTPTVARHNGSNAVTGADLTIDNLAVARQQQKWATTKPATVRVHGGVVVDGLALASGAQKLNLSARYRFDDGALEAHVQGRALDARQLAALAQPAQAAANVPKTSLNLDVAARGTSAKPVADVALEGYSERNDQLGIPRIDAKLTLRYADDRAKGDLACNAGGQSVKTTLDLPLVLTGSRPLALDLEVKDVALAQWRRMLPATLAELDGKLDASVKATGTTDRPELAVDVHGRAVALGEQAKNNDLHVTLGYKNKELSAKADVTLQQQVLGRNAGALSVELSLPLGLTLGMLQSKPAALLQQLQSRTRLAAKVKLTKLDLARFPFAALGLAPPVRAGELDGSMKLTGTMRQPLVAFDLEGHQLAAGKADKIELALSAGYRKDKATVDLSVSLRGSPLVKLQGEAPIDVERLLNHQSISGTPLKVDGQIPGFDLARVQDVVPQLAGKLTAAVVVRGTVAKPTAKLDADIAQLNLGTMQYDKFQAQVVYDDAQAVAKIEAHEVKGGNLSVAATLPAAAAQPIAATVRAQNFYVDLANQNLTNPRLVKGTLSAQIDAHGPRSAPTITGFVRFDNGQLALADDPRLYTNIKVDVGIAPGRITLKSAEAKLGEGSIKANGYVALDGLKPKSMDLRAYPRKFPIAPGNIGTFVDADVHAQGSGDAEGMTGTITIEKGTARLPALADVAGRQLQSTGPLPDVKFTDPEALRAAAKEKKDEAEAATISLSAKIPGPFHIRGKELSTDLSGNLGVDIAGSTVRVRGRVEAGAGWIEILSRRYNIEKLQVVLAGEIDPNPQLDVRLTREMSEAMLVIEVHGTAKKPQLLLSCDPPIYDQSEIIGAILSGDPAQQREDNRSLDQKATGAISGLVVGKIKDQIAPNLPIDVIKVDTGGSSSSDSTGLGDTRIEVGKYITDTIYVSYVHQFGLTTIGTQRLNANEADLEWRFKKRYELETAFGDAAVGRVNLYWTVRY
jgi:translocation and assembly module TamB